jgi:hypothetical protein
MFIAGVNDTGEKLFAGVNDTGEKFNPIYFTHFPNMLMRALQFCRLFNFCDLVRKLIA